MHFKCNFFRLKKNYISVPTNRHEDNSSCAIIVLFYSYLCSPGTAQVSVTNITNFTCYLLYINTRSKICNVSNTLNT